jgi:protein-disulfide isomerase
MRLTGESKVLLGILAATIVIIGIAIMVFTKPVPTLARENLIPTTSHTKGNPQARVYLVEFSDYQCPACKAVKPIINQLTETYKDKLVFVFRHYPLDQHPFSQQAAEIAEAAGAQGKFWEMSDLLFEHQDALSEHDIPTFAKQLEIDESFITSALAAGTYRQKVLDDKEAGDRFGVTATPTFYLNGKKLDLVTFEDLSKAVKQAIAQ